MMGVEPKKIKKKKVDTKKTCFEYTMLIERMKQRKVSEFFFFLMKDEGGGGFVTFRQR